ncbi:MAG TPA: heme exporter protein CcmB [Candidatus Acidoferrales bacterium]|jgi:heme exporter protein B|nr:heme exporter protein CcmB [Candidatus Acidoferrales bacterium]
MNAPRATLTILSKELRAEFRSFELLTSTIVFVLIVVFIFSYAFDPTSEGSRRFGPGLLWIALLFAGSLMLQPSFSRERVNDTLGGLRLAPIAPVAILAGKLLANLLFLLLVEAALLPVFGVLYNIPLASVAAPLALVMLMGTLGVATIGTVFSAIASHARMRELLLPLLLLPALTPVLIASTEATAGLLADPYEFRTPWLVILAAFDIIFLTATWLFGEYLLEE